jgi:hypothetical protein
MRRVKKTRPLHSVVTACWTHCRAIATSSIAAMVHIFAGVPILNGRKE